MAITMKERKLRAVIYTRVSTTGQVEDGYGLEVQTKAVQTFARDHGIRIVRECEDPAISGATDALDRPGLSCALEAIEAGHADVLVIPRLDRLARELTVQEGVLAHVWRHGGRVFTAESGEVLSDDPDDPMRTAMRQMVGVFAQLERAMIAKRMRDGRRAKAEAGGYAGGAPRFGVRAEGKTLVPADNEIAVRETFERWQADGLSLRQIVVRANAEALPSKRGGAWHLSTVSRVLSPPSTDADRGRADRAKRAKTAAHG